MKMRPYKRISKGALALLVAGAISAGGMAMSYANLASADENTPQTSESTAYGPRPWGHRYGGMVT